MMTVLVASIWQGLVIATATELLLRCTPRLNAATRYVVWWMALFAVLALPIAHFLVAPPFDELSIIPATSAVATPRAFILPTPPDWLIACAGGIWLGTVLLGVARVAGGIGQVMALKRRTRPLDESVRRNLTYWNRTRCSRCAELRLSREVAGACALGLIGSPVIVLSDRLIHTLDADAIDQIVLHEQAHLSRYDDWTALAQACMCALLGLHPAVRLISQRIDVEREATCDDLVVMRTGGAARYAHCLARAAEAVAAESRLLAAVSLNATGSGGLLVRVQRLLDPRVPRHARLQLAVAATGLFAFVTAALAGPNARLVVMADAMALLPEVHGAPAHRAIDWASRAASMPHLPEDETRVALVSPERQGPSRAAQSVTAATNHVEPPQVAVPAIALAVSEPEADRPPIELPPLQSRALLPALVPTAPRFADSQTPPWSYAGEVGVVVGESFARMGTWTGARTKRAGIAVGEFFNRTGKAVADSF